MKILITGESNYLIGRDNNEYRMVKYIADKDPVNIKLVMDNNLTHQLVDDFAPDIVVSFNCGGLKSQETLGFFTSKQIPFCLMLDDVFHFESVSSGIPKECDAIIMLVKWTVLIDQYKRRFPSKIIKNMLSRYLDVEKFRPMNLAKEYDVFFYGTDDVDTICPLNDLDYQYFDKDWMSRNNTTKMPEMYNYYPLRKRLRDLFLKHQDKYRTNIYVPQGSWFPVPPIRNEKLSEVINKSHLVICTRARSDTLMKKHLEIAGSGSVILGNAPSDYKDLFDGHIIEVKESMSDEEILLVVDKALSDTTGLSEMGMNLSHKIHSGHNYDCAYDDFLELCTEIVTEYQVLQTRD
jgi:hypothetical protein